VTGFAQRHKVFIPVRAAIFYRDYVVRFHRWGHFSSLLAFGTEGILCQEQFAYFSPSGIIMCGIGAAIVLLAMLRAVSRSGFYQHRATHVSALPL